MVHFLKSYCQGYICENLSKKELKKQKKNQSGREEKDGLGTPSRPPLRPYAGPYHAWSMGMVQKYC
jgi:hypothetical protein